MTKTQTKSIISNIAIALAIAIFFIADRALKALALANPEASFSIIGSFFQFSFTTNKNIAFSLPIAGFWLIPAIIILIALIVLYIIYLIINKKSDYRSVVGLTIIVIGAIINILDRIKYGFVIDYLELKHFAVFNLADVLISIGILLVLIKTVHFETRKTDSGV